MSTTSASSSSAESAGDEAAQLAFDVYVHRLKHYVGAYLALLGGLDVLIFTAGVGENSPALRAAVVEGLDGLGIGSTQTRTPSRSESRRVISPDGAADHGRGGADQRGARHRPPDRRPARLPLRFVGGRDSSGGGCGNPCHEAFWRSAHVLQTLHLV